MNIVLKVSLEIRKSLCWLWENIILCWKGVKILTGLHICYFAQKYCRSLNHKNHIILLGYYVESSRPETVSLSQEDMTVAMTTEILEGCEGTGIRAGIIGEIGCSWPLQGMVFILQYLKLLKDFEILTYFIHVENRFWIRKLITTISLVCPCAISSE